MLGLDSSETVWKDEDNFWPFWAHLGPFLAILDSFRLFLGSSGPVYKKKATMYKISPQAFILIQAIVHEYSNLTAIFFTLETILAWVREGWVLFLSSLNPLYLIQACVFVKHCQPFSRLLQVSFLVLDSPNYSRYLLGRAYLYLKTLEIKNWRWVKWSGGH